MNDRAAGRSDRRRYPARAGITALNLIGPGLGLLRIGRWRAGLSFLLAPYAMLPLLTIGMGHAPITSYDRARLAPAVLLGVLAALYVAPAVLTWRGSRSRSPARGWSRWYGLSAIAILMLLLEQGAASAMHHFYKPFYMPSESMAPTIATGDKLVADMRWRGPYRRGEVIVFTGPVSVRVSRIVALPGDRIAMRGGVPVLNGVAAIQSAQGRTTFPCPDGTCPAAISAEQLPGEASPHRVLDTGLSEFDDMAERVVPADHLFVLGDNRDRAADSRVPAALHGVGMVPLTAVLGRPMFIHWSRDHGRVGTRLDR